MQIQDAPFDTLLVMQEPVDDEIRLTYYVRRASDEVKPSFVATYRLACIQGCPWRP